MDGCAGLVLEVHHVGATLADHQSHLAIGPGGSFVSCITNREYRGIITWNSNVAFDSKHDGGPFFRDRTPPSTRLNKQGFNLT